uniref:Ashwin n=1 Tax=Mesocestoides corti TaxID=53468 RepID=A0A5K3FVN1_MESCO
VIVDRRTKRTCDVGGFVLLYKQKLALPNQLRAACATRAHQSRLLKRTSGSVVPIRNLVLQPPKPGLREKPGVLPSIVRTASVKAKRPHLGTRNDCSSAAHFLHASGTSNNNSSRDYRTDEENRMPTPSDNHRLNRQPATPKATSRRIATPSRSPLQVSKALKPPIRTRSCGAKSSLQAVLELQQMARPSGLKQSPATRSERSTVFATKLTN